MDLEGENLPKGNKIILFNLSLNFIKKNLATI